MDKTRLDGSFVNIPNKTTLFESENAFLKGALDGGF